MNNKQQLELEAENYANQINKNWFGMKLPEKNKDTKKDFVAGATSKWVEKQKLEFAIEYLYLVRNSCFDIENRIQELEQKLSEL